MVCIPSFCAYRRALAYCFDRPEFPERGRPEFPELTTHAIVAEALIAELPAEARAALHTRAFAGLAVLGDAPGVRVQRAHQHLSAVLLGAPPSNVDVVNDAIRWLDESGAPDRAFELERRRHHARSLGVLPPATTDELIATAQLAARAGSFEAARRIAFEAIARAFAEDDAVRFAEATLTLGLDTTAGKVDPVLIEALERVRDRLPADAEPLRVRVSARLAAARQPAPEPGPFVGLARDAIERAVRLGDDVVLCDALYYGGAALTDCVPPAELRTVAEQLLEVAVRQRDRARTLRAAARLALASGALGDFAGVDRAIDLLAGC